MTLNELFEIYVAKRLRGCSSNTIRLYKHSIAAFTKSLGHETTLNELTDENIQRHMWRLVDEGRSRATANKDCAQLCAIWRFANRNNLISSWPSVRKLQEPERVPLGWLPHEIDKIFESIDREPGRVSTAPAKLWWKCLLLVLIDTGERIGPMRKLPRTSLAGQYLLIPAELRKRGTRDKLYKLSAKTAVLLADLLSTHNEPMLFPWDRCETYLYNRYTGILTRAGLSHDSKSKFHRLRKTTASIVKRMGGDAQAAMDHSSARTTRAYLDPRIVGEIPTSEFIERYRKQG